MKRRDVLRRGGAAAAVTAAAASTFPAPAIAQGTKELKMVTSWPKNYHYPGLHEPGSMLGLGIRKKLWDGPSKADQELFRACAGAENNYDLAEFNANNSAALDTLVNKHGVKVHEFSDEIFKGMGEASKDVLASAGAADPSSKEVYESFMRFRKIAVGWSKLSDEAYMAKRSLVPF